MSGPGRKPNPTWRRRLDGNPGKRPLNQSEPVLPASVASFDAVPSELIDDAGASAEWSRVAPMLRKAKQITDGDRTALIALCVEWSRYLAAVKKIAVEGMLVVTPNGHPVPSPYINIARHTLQACGRLWSDLGMTPSSRSKVQVSGDEPDAFAEFDQPASRSAS